MTAAPLQVGRPIPTEQLIGYFPPPEGTIDLIYGRIGQGKTYAAVADIIEDLKHGIPVYANFKIDWSGYDERTDFLYIISGLLGIKRRFHKFDHSNFHYLPLDDQFMDVFEKLTDCKVYLDEGHIIFDSYLHAKFSMRKRTSILHTRHFNRSIIIISQRPSAIHVSARGNVNRFFKVEKWISWPVLLFTKTEYQDMTNEMVDEEKPIRTKLYFGRKNILRAYNSKYLRGGIETSQKVHFEAWRMGSIRSLKLLWYYFFPPKHRPAESSRRAGGQTRLSAPAPVRREPPITRPDIQAAQDVSYTGELLSVEEMKERLKNKNKINNMT